MKKITTLLLSTVFVFKTFVSKARHRVVRVALFLIILSGFSSYAVANIQEKRDIAEMAERSGLIIRGKVISTESQWKEDSRGRHIYTSVTVRILDKIKGNIKDDAVAFEVVGGIVGDIGEVVSGTAVFGVDEEVIVFLGGEPLTIQHGTNGKILIYDGRVYRDGLEVTVDSFIESLKILEQDSNAAVSLGEEYQGAPAEATGVATVTSVSFDEAPDGTNAQVTITGTNFGSKQGSSKVEFFYESRQQKKAASIVSWSDTEIICAAPVGIASAGKSLVIVTTSDGASSGYVIEAADCYIYGGQKWFGTSPVVSYRINENTSDCVGEGAAVRRAADTWNDVGANFEFRYDGSCSSTGASQNYINCITWGTVLSGAVAETTSWFYPSTGEIVECDIVFNDPGYTWNSEGPPASWEWDIESVALHEFGHWLRLEDLYDVADKLRVMYWQRSAGFVIRELCECDCDGMCHIYGGYNCGAYCPLCEVRLCSECEPEDADLGTIGTVPWYSVSGNCGNGGKWVGQFVGESGATYHFDLCPDSPGSGTNSGFDPDIKIVNSWCSILDGEDGSCSSPSYSPNDYQWVCTSGGTYYVIIAPFSSYNSHSCDGESSDTFTLKYYKQGCSPPPAPMGVSASDGTYCDKVRVDYYSVWGATGYEIWRNTTNNSGSASKIGDDSSPPYDDFGAAAGVTYYYWVKAKNSCGTSGFSSSDPGYRLSAPSAPTGVWASDGTYCDKVRVNWNSVSGATGFEIWRNTTNNSGSASKIGEDSSSPYDDVPPECGVTYYYWVKAKNSCGTGGFSSSDPGYCTGQCACSAGVDMDELWMYQNLPGQMNCTLTACASITDDPMGNSSYSYAWEFILPSDVSLAPVTVEGGGAGDACWTFASRGCDEPEGLSDSGQVFTVRVTVTGDDYGNTCQAEVEFGIALLGDVNNDRVVNVGDRSIVNAFWRTGSAGVYTFRDCNLNCDSAVNVADRSIANAVWRGTLCQNSVSEPCPLR
ncbi:MAG: IPT/TIG domain-containing protein [Planctomycetota bacterium]|nr:MAG: IPT/TIG domain-containing protein [Planctomycetota bacterium]